VFRQEKMVEGPKIKRIFRKHGGGVLGWMGRGGLVRKKGGGGGGGVHKGGGCLMFQDRGKKGAFLICVGWGGKPKLYGQKESEKCLLTWGRNTFGGRKQPNP